MAFDPHANLAYSLVAVAPSPASSGTSLTLSTGDGALFPDPAGIGYEVTIWPTAEFPLQTNAEIVRVTAKVGDVLTIVRQQGGTSARSIVVGDQIALTVTKKSLEDIESRLSAPLAVSAGASSASLSALTFSNSNGVSFGLSNGVITGTVATNYQSQGAYLTTAALSQDSSKYAGTNGAITGGSITVNTSGVSVDLPAYLTTAMASNRGSDFVQATAQFAGTNASGTIASSGISVSVNAGAAQSNQTVGLYASSNTYLTSSGTVDARSLTFRGDKSITVGVSDGQIAFSVGAYLTTAMASNRGSDFVNATAAFAGTSASGTIASNGISVSIGPYLTTAMLSNAVTLSNIRVSAGNTSNLLSRITFADSNGLAFGLSDSTITGSYTVPTVTNSSWSISDNGTSGTVARLAFTNLNGVTLSLSTGNAGSHTIVGSHNAITSQSTQFLALTLGGNSAGTSTFHATNNASLFFNGGNNITLSGNGSTVTISAAAQTNQSAIEGFGVSNTGQTAGNTGISTGIDWILAGSQSITLSQSTAAGSATVWIQHPAWITTARASTDAIGLNTAQTNVTWTVNSSGLSLNAGGYAGTVSGATNCSVTVNTSGVSVNVPQGTLSMWPDVLPASTAVSTYYSGSTSQGAGGASTQTGYTFSLYAVPLPLPQAVAFSEIRLGVSNNTAAGTGSVTHLWSGGFYTNNASTLSLVKAYYGGLFLSQNSQTSQTFSVFTFSTGGATAGGNGGFAGLAASSVYSRAVANMSSDSQMFGRLQFAPFGAATTLTAGQYYFVFGFKSVSSGANVYSNVGWLQSNAIQSINVPDLGRENSTQTSNYLPAWGAISTTFTSVSNQASFFPLPNAINIANMSLSSSDWLRFHFPVLRNHS